MNCLKCGRETDQTFCEYCRESMKKYPIKPGSYVVLPKKNRVPKRNSQRRDPIPPEIRIANLRRIIQRMWLVILALVVLLVSMGYAIYRLWEEGDSRPVGQNYSTVTKSTETIETDTTAESK